MKAPVIVFCLLAGFNLGAVAFLHGKPKEGKWNFGVTAVGIILETLLLWWGGFFA